MGQNTLIKNAPEGGSNSSPGNPSDGGAEPLAPKAGYADLSSDRSLTRVVSAWPAPPQHIRAAVLPLVTSATLPSIKRE
jgi:hypothetical protein